MKMLMQLAGLFAGVVAGSVSNSVQAGTTVLLPEIGGSEVRLDENYWFTGDDKRDSGFVQGVLAGYRFDSNIVVAAKLDFHEGDLFFGAFDSFKLRERGVLVGYSISLAPRFRLTPAIGLSYWNLDSREGRLFNPGDEESRDFRGRDIYGRVNFEIPVSELITLNLAYSYGEYDFGHLETTRFGVMFTF